jgi:hypothetical protein
MRLSQEAKADLRRVIDATLEGRGLLGTPKR